MEREQETELRWLQQRYAQRVRGRDPARMSDVLNDLLARRGYLQTLAAEQLLAAWQAAAGAELAADTRPGKQRGGILEILAADSCLVQELTFRKAELLRRLREQAPHIKVRDLRFRVGSRN